MSVSSDSLPSEPFHRQWVTQEQERLGVNREDVLFTASNNDPMNMGTSTDYKKAQWFAELWEEAVENRRVKEIHIRGLHYYIVTTKKEDVPPPNPDCDWSRYTNTDSCFGYLNQAAKRARVLNYVPWDGVIDEKNDRKQITHYTGSHSHNPQPNGVRVDQGVGWPTIPTVNSKARMWFESGELVDYLAEEIISEAENNLSFDESLQQPFHIELWSEKSIPQEVKRIAEMNGVDVIVEGEGNLSYWVTQKFTDTTNAAGKPAVVLYLADYDFAGADMPSAMASAIRFKDFQQELKQRVVVKRLAITAEQVEEHGFPREIISDADLEALPPAARSRVEDWQAEHGEGYVELNVLEGNFDLYKSIVRDALTDLTDNSIWSYNTKAKKQWRGQALEIARDELEDSELADLELGVREQTEQFNNRLESMQDDFDELRNIKESDVVTEWGAAIQRVANGIELPPANVPKGSSSLPDDPLYDSWRDPDENLARIKGEDD